ncbi:MAG: DNA polymerase III subunit delta [Anaerolineales bacterium]|nr:DNA polymerase III subunit delta [Anaerolineales bacterium]
MATQTFYILHGDDEYSIKAQVSSFKQKMGDDLNINEYDGAKTSPQEVVAVAQAMPFLSDRRLVIVYGMLGALGSSKAKSAKENLHYLVDNLPHLPESARLVFVEYQTLSDNHAVVKLVQTEPSGYIKAFSAPKNPTAWIQKRVGEYGVKTEPRAVAALAAVVDGDLRRADNELYKLAAYVGQGGTITEREVALLTPYVPESNVFEMVDAMGQRDGKTAMGLLHKLLENDRQDPMAVFGMIIRQFRLLVQARELIDGGANAKGVSQALGIHSFVAEKVSKQARGFSQAQLDRIYQNLLTTDQGVKTGKVSIEVALDLLIAGIAGG